MSAIGLLAHIGFQVLFELNGLYEKGLKRQQVHPVTPLSIFKGQWSVAIVVIFVSLPPWTHIIFYSGLQ